MLWFVCARTDQMWNFPKISFVQSLCRIESLTVRNDVVANVSVSKVHALHLVEAWEGVGSVCVWCCCRFCCCWTPNAFQYLRYFIAFSTNFACLSSIPSSSNVFDLAHTILPTLMLSLLTHFFCAFHLVRVHSPHPFDQKFSRFSVSSEPWLDAGTVIGCRFAVVETKASETLLKFFF